MLKLFGFALLPNEKNRYAAMEGIRGYAVLAIFHVHIFTAYSHGFNNKWPHHIKTNEIDTFTNWIIKYFYSSHYGVDLFFLLSGFLVYRMTRKDYKYLLFLKNRFLRIYPAFLVSTLIYIIVRTFFIKIYPFDIENVIKNIFLFNGLGGLFGVSARSYNIVTWSLAYEFIFYATFPFIFALGRRRFTHLLVIFAVFYMASMYMPFGWIKFTMFFVGAMIASIEDDNLISIANGISDALVITAYFLFTLFYLYNPKPIHFYPIYWIISSFLVINGVFGKGLLNKIFSLSLFRSIGNLSYSFYLMHILGIWITKIIVIEYMDIDASLGAFIVLYITAFIISLIFSSILFYVAEKPYFLFKKKHYSKESK